MMVDETCMETSVRNVVGSGAKVNGKAGSDFLHHSPLVGKTEAQRVRNSWLQLSTLRLNLVSTKEPEHITAWLFSSLPVESKKQSPENKENIWLCTQVACVWGGWVLGLQAGRLDPFCEVSKAHPGDACVNWRGPKSLPHLGYDKPRRRGRLLRQLGLFWVAEHPGPSETDAKQECLLLVLSPWAPLYASPKGAVQKRLFLSDLQLGKESHPQTFITVLPFLFEMSMEVISPLCR